LCSLGGCAGIAVGIVAVHALLQVSPADLPRLAEASAGSGLDWRMLAFALAACLATALLFGTFSAWAVRPERLADALQQAGGRQGTGVRSRRSQSVVVISEVALSLVLGAYPGVSGFRSPQRASDEHADARHPP